MNIRNDIRSTRRLVVHSHKGGVGKTTFCYNLIKLIMSNEFKINDKIIKDVLILDLDSQMNLTCSLLLDSDLKSNFESKLVEMKLTHLNNEFDLFDAYIANHVDIEDSKEDGVMKKTRQEKAFDIYNKLDLRLRPGLYEDKKKVFEIYRVNRRDKNRRIHLIPGSADTFKLSSSIDRNISHQDAINILNQFLASYTVDDLEHKGVAIQKEYDLIILDLAPDLSSLNQCLIRASSYVLIPSTPDYFSRISIKLLRRNLLDTLMNDNNAPRDYRPIILGGFLSKSKKILEEDSKTFDKFISSIEESARDEQEGFNTVNRGFNFGSLNKFVIGGIRSFESLAPEMGLQHKDITTVKTKGPHQKKMKIEAINNYTNLIEEIFHRMTIISEAQSYDVGIDYTDDESSINSSD